jgi:hypothetical protein
MEMPQGNSLCSYLKQTKMSFFFFYKIGKQVGKTGTAWNGRGEKVGKECGMVQNTV